MLHRHCVVCTLHNHTRQAGGDTNQSAQLWLVSHAQAPPAGFGEGHDLQGGMEQDQLGTIHLPQQDNVEK